MDATIIPAMDLEKELTCSICTDILYQPLTLLDCLHTFCGACLKEWFSWQALAAETNPNPPALGKPIFTCPSCRDAVRSTKHNATVATLLDMLLSKHPEKRRSDEEMAEMDSKYRPGDNVLPKVHLPKRTPEQQRLDAAEQRLIDEVRQISRQEAVAAAMGGGNAAAASPPSARDVRRMQRQAAAGAGIATDPASDDDSRLHRISGADAHLSHMMGHQSSLRSLISNSQDGSGGAGGVLDIEREIEAFARQIQEEGLLDGLDLDNIDLTNDDELSRRIAEAYQRHQRGRARHDTSSGSGYHRDRSRAEGSTVSHNRHRASSAVSHRSQASISGVPPAAQPERTSGRATLTVASAAAAGRPPSSSSRASSRHRSHSQSSHRSRPSTSSAYPQSAVVADNLAPSPSSVGPATRTSASPATSSRPSAAVLSPSSQHLEVRDDPRRHHQRRRTASEGRSITMPITPSPNAATQRPLAHSQTDLPLRPVEPRRPRVGLPELLSPSSPSSSNSSLEVDKHSPTAASFQARVSATGMQDIPGAAGGASGGIPSQVKRLAAGLSSEAPSSTAQPPLVIATAKSPPPTPVVTANVTLSPVIQESHERSSISGTIPPVAARQQQQQQTCHSRQCTLFPEPDISCCHCQRPHIEYDVHYNCAICLQGTWNICQACYRAGHGCHHWFGFGYAAHKKWEKAAADAAAAGNTAYAKPHTLTATRFIRPRVASSGVDDRRMLTSDDPASRLQRGVFCACCNAWANNCFWCCDVCNSGEWAFCNDCVNQGRCCTHPLLPLTHQPKSSVLSPEGQAAHSSPRPPALSELPAASTSGDEVPPSPLRSGEYRVLTFTTTCDLCRKAIPPTQARFHCYTCRSTVQPGANAGDYDVCHDCYGALVAPPSSVMAAENGPRGWRRCPSGGHRMVVAAFREDHCTGLSWRVVFEELVGGVRLEVEAAEAAVAAEAHSLGVDVESWYIWYAGKKMFPRLVARDVHQAASAVRIGPVTATAVDVLFPPLGGVGFTAVARWAYYPDVRGDGGHEGEGGGNGNAGANADSDTGADGHSDDSGGADDELMFPRGAEIREIEDVNGEWFHGVYMGREGLFPSAYVHVQDA